jgi:hypothetical protein
MAATRQKCVRPYPNAKKAWECGPEFKPQELPTPPPPPISPVGKKKKKVAGDGMTW